MRSPLNTHLQMFARPWGGIRLIFFLFCLIVAAAQASSETLPLADISHSAWTARDGAPTDITSLAQTADGYLWIGTPLGLHRFDGLKFSDFPMTPADPKLPGREISALAADSTDGLWIGFSHGGLSHLVDRSVTNIALPEPYKGAAVNVIYCCSDNFLWVLAGDTILRWDGHSWSNIGAKYGLPAASYFTVFFDRDGNIWAAARHHAYFLKSGSTRFQDVGRDVFSITQFAQSSDGTIWVSDGWRSVRPIMSGCKSASVRLQGTAAVVFDRSGRLWFAEDALGVGRISNLSRPCERAPTVESFINRDGLTANVTRSVLMDRDGNIWVGTELGLDRFRPRSFLSVLEGHFKFYPAFAVAPDGSIWAEAHGMPLQHITEQGAVSIGKKLGSSPIAIDEAGMVWLLDPWDHKLHSIDTRSRQDISIEVPPQFEDTAAQHIAALRDGTILVNFEGNGLWSYKGLWQRTTIAGLPDGIPTSLNIDRAGLWIGYDNSRIYHLPSGSTRAIDRSAGLDIGTVLTTLTARNMVWAAGTEGVAYAKENRFRSLRLKGPTLTQGASGIALDDDGNLWLNSGAGIVRISDKELQLALQDPRHRASVTVYGEADGVLGTPAQAKPVPSMVKDKKGKLYIATSGFILQTTPSLFNRTRRPPTIAIQAIKVDGSPTRFGSRASPQFLLQGGRDNRLEIDYAGIDLNTPTEVSYRYLLEGFDTNWQFVDQSREAVYAGLGPATYRFRVAATVDGDHWIELAEPLIFTVVPAFYQRMWFMALCALPIAFMLWLLYLMRLRYVTARIRDRLEQRTGERLRIARELHDTLLQSIHGLMLRFHYATEALEEDHPARPVLQDVLQRADGLIVEGRNRVQNLRGEADRNRSLADLIAQAVRELRSDDGPTIHVTEEGLQQPMRTIVKDEICRICRECLVNSLTHSKASSIVIEIEYGATFFGVRCKDNGCGIESDVLREGGKKGHWGLRGMKERARSVGGTLTIWSAPGRGTEIEVRLRAAAAYDNPLALARFLFRASQQFRSANLTCESPSTNSQSPAERVGH